MVADEGKPVPDPTVLTTEALIRAVAAERDYVDGVKAVLEERLRAIDVATRLLNETVNRVPTDVTKQVSHLRELTDVRFDSVSTQFKERDTRSEREARDNKLAVDAAFAAQEKQAVAQNESNTLAINKSEIATAETIKTNQELATSKIDALTKGQDEMRLTLNTILSTKQGGREAYAGIYSLAGFIASALIILGALVALR
jgi:cation transport regulator ChaB